MHIQSDDSDTYFSDNRPFNFKIHLKYPLLLNGTWKVGLTAFYTALRAEERKNESPLYIYCNFCKESIVHGDLQRLLRYIPPSKPKKWKYSFDNVYYIPISRDEIIEMEFHIKTRDGQFASFLSEPVIIELHFKPYPFLM